MDDVYEILSSQDVIPIDMLSNLGRKSLRSVLRSDDDSISFDEIQQLWKRIQWTACSPVVVDKHLTAACNAICVFVRGACQSVCDQVRAFGCSEQVWFEAFEVVRKAFGDGKNKPALQVLEALIENLHENADIANSVKILENAVKELITIILTGEPAMRIKEACIAISAFLKRSQDLLPAGKYFQRLDYRETLVLKQRYRQANIQNDCLRSLDEDPLGHFLLALLLAASLSESRTAAIKLFSLLCTKSEKLDMSHNIRIASLAIEVYLEANDLALKEFSVDVFPAVLNNQDQFNKLSKQFGPSKEPSVSRLSIFLAIVQAGRQKGMVAEAELPYIIKTAVAPLMMQNDSHSAKYQGFDYILKCDTPTIRLQAFHLLTTSNATNAQIPSGALECLSRSFGYLHNGTDPAYRDEYVSIARRLHKRLVGCLQAMSRQGNSDESPINEVRKHYDCFYRTWNSFLRTELSPQASYQRHILALQTLHVLSTTPSFGNVQTTEYESRKHLVSALFNLVFDAFDDVRSQAASLLVKMSAECPHVLAEFLQKFQLISLAEKMSAQTSRADHADALGRLYVLDAMITSHLNGSLISGRGGIIPGCPEVMKLATTVENYVEQIWSFTSSSTFPLHGSLLGLSYIIQTSNTKSSNLDRASVECLLRICSRVWSLAQKDLCVDSPETASEEESKGGAEGPKDLLAYSWRALRDSSLVMQAMLETQNADSGVFQPIGNLCLEQLIKLRHRGAFSAVAQTFALCCQKCRDSNIKSYYDINQAWLELAFLEIENQSNKLTRRSAGIPSMFAATLDPKNLKQFLSGIERLAHIAQQGPSTEGLARGELFLPQIHALNCLKDAMTNSRFRTMTESLVVEMLNLAAYSLRSDIWGIRNCGLMLFRACINRLTPDSSTLYGFHEADVGKVATETPLAVAVNLLQNEQPTPNNTHTLGISSEGKDSEIVFAALDLVAHIPRRPDGDQVVNDLVSSQLGNKLWAVREHAAQLQASRSSEIGGQASLTLLQTIDASYSANLRHGLLLCALYTFRKQWSRLAAHERQAQHTNFEESLIELCQMTVGSYPHPLVLAATFDLLNESLVSLLENDIVPRLTIQASETLMSSATGFFKISSLFLLRRSLMLNQVYTYIYHKTVEAFTNHDMNFTASLTTKLTEGSDVAIYVIEELRSHLARKYPAIVLTIVIALAQACKSADAKSAALLTLSTHIPLAADSLSEPEVIGLIRMIDLSNSPSRDMWNSQMKFAVCLVKICSGRRISLDSCLLEVLFDALRLSQQDEVEMPTRLYAVESMMDLTSLLLINDNSANRLVHIELCSILYDLLNDDDEDIRILAAASTYRIIQAEQSLPYVITGCGLAARETLLDLMVIRFGHCRELCTKAGMRIIGAAPSTGLNDIETILTYCHDNSVSELVERELQRATDLFAEERQNLYIDDLSEIKAWAMVAEDQLLGLDFVVIQALSTWAFEGLISLSSLLTLDSKLSKPASRPQEEEKSNIVHPLGLTYNSEILIIFIRVITVAGLLRSDALLGDRRQTNKVYNQHMITEQLQNIRTICNQNTIHEHILSALDHSLRGE